jgi:hypothetical protein
MHATLRKLRTRFDSWQGHFGSKMRQNQRRASSRPRLRRLATRVPHMGSDRKPCQPLVSSVGRAPDQESGCDGFDSRTNYAGRKTARYEECPREVGQCVIGHRTAACRRSVRHAASLAARPSAMQYVDTAFVSHQPTGGGCPASCNGACPVGDKHHKTIVSAEGSAETQTALRTRPCDHRWFRRPTALPNSNPVHNWNDAITTAERKA